MSPHDSLVWHRQHSNLCHHQWVLITRWCVSSASAMSINPTPPPMSPRDSLAWFPQCPPLPFALPSPVQPLRLLPNPHTKWHHTTVLHTVPRLLIWSHKFAISQFQCGLTYNQWLKHLYEKVNVLIFHHATQSNKKKHCFYLVQNKTQYRFSEAYHMSQMGLITEH